jgi:hypothetical protein
MKTQASITMTLVKAQMAALDHIRQYALSRQGEARNSISPILKMTNVPQATFTAAMDAIKSHARVALHFHPDLQELKLLWHVPVKYGKPWAQIAKGAHS